MLDDWPRETMRAVRFLRVLIGVAVAAALAAGAVLALNRGGADTGARVVRVTIESRFVHQGLP